MKFEKYKVAARIDYTQYKVGDTIKIPEEFDDTHTLEDNSIALFMQKEHNTKKFIGPNPFYIDSDDYGRLSLMPLKLIEDAKLLSSYSFTAQLSSQIDNFFQKLDIYTELDVFPKRTILLHSAPGMGKTASIRHFCLEYLQNGETAVLLINPMKIDMADTGRFLAICAMADSVKKMILIIEDIGGDTGEKFNGDISSLLNFLDGAEQVYKVPTFIIATTNYIEQLAGTLADRPGRFDTVIEIPYPNGAERVALIEFISKKAVSAEERALLLSDSANELSIAYLKEIVIRMRLNDLSMKQVLIEIKQYRERQKSAFEKQTKFGFGDD